MRYSLILLLLVVGLVRSAHAAEEYFIDFGLVLDLEELRPLVDLCADFGALERHRTRLERTSDLESLRDLLERVGVARFEDCPRIKGLDGVTRITTRSKGRDPNVGRQKRAE